MKKLSAYWWCQIIGWGTFLLITLFYYFFVPGFTSFTSFYDIIIVTVAGFCSSHLMRFFIIKTKLLNKKIWQQLIFLFLTTILFSFIYTILQLVIFSVVYADYSISLSNLLNKLLSIGFLNTNFLIVWNLIYFIHHYIQKSRNHLIETIRLENELRLKQLESEKAQIEYQRNLGNYYLMALRYQMNPHFIFNCLNSIKLYTIQNDTASATEYLTKFSKLIRLVMENSAKGKIVLTSELNMLRLYIELEAMRFKEKLEYHFTIEKNVEVDYIELPPLLLQPYVENAIWHGLMPKEEGGKIDINVAMNTDKSLLEISIIDNGIGRIKSAALNSKYVNKHESYGMKVTSDRIALINQVYKTGAAVKIDDLVDENNKPSGTKVMIQIPV